MNRYANFLPVKLPAVSRIVLPGLLCSLGMLAVSCGGSTEVAEANRRGAEAAEAAASAALVSPGQILQKPLAVGVDSEGVKQLTVGSPIQANALTFQLTDKPVVSVQYKLISTSEDELDKITEKEIFGAVDGDELTISLPVFEGCSLVKANNVIERLSGVCVGDVAVMLPANQKIDVYAATSYAADGDLPFPKLAWPAAVPEDTETLGKTMSIDMDEFEHQLLLVERFVAEGKAEKMVVNDIWPLLDSVSGSSKKLAIIERVAEPLKATYGSEGIPADDMQTVMSVLWEGDRAKAQSLLN